MSFNLLDRVSLHGDEYYTFTRIQTAEEIFRDLYNIMTLARPPNC